MERAYLRYGCGVADTNHKRATEWIGWGEYLPTQRRVVSEREGMEWKTYKPNSMKNKLKKHFNQPATFAFYAFLAWMAFLGLIAITNL